MSIEKKTTEGRQEPKYLKLLENKFRTWTRIEDEELSEALNDLCGDSYFEMRKMTAQICRAIEQGNVPEPAVLVGEVKRIIDDTWRSIIDKQKVGVDKLGIVVRKHLKDV